MVSTKLIEKPAAPRTQGASPRTPSRRPGARRYAALLDATSELLLTEAPDTIGLYQIAEQAGVPPTSVYHFFPTKEAAYVALAQRCCEELIEVLECPIEARSIRDWQDLYRIDVRRAMEFYNAYPPYMKIIYGGYGGVDAHNVDKLLAVHFAGSSYDRFNRIFHMPTMSEPEKKFEIRVGLIDSVWQISVRGHGRITEEYFEESVKAAIAYSRLYIPDHLEPRQLLVEAAQSGGTIRLPYYRNAGDTERPSDH